MKLKYNKIKFRNFMMVIFVFMINVFIFINKVNAEAQTNDSSIDCNSWGDAKRDMQNVFDFMKVVIPLLIIGLSTFDFIKAIVQKDDKDIKKAFTRLIKRFIFSILLFFIPVILEFLLYIFEINNDICIK